MDGEILGGGTVGFEEQRDLRAIECYFQGNWSLENIPIPGGWWATLSVGIVHPFLFRAWEQAPGIQGLTREVIRLAWRLEEGPDSVETVNQWGAMAFLWPDFSCYLDASLRVFS